MRQYDAGYAIEQVRQLPIVDDTNIFLTGFSEGAITAAAFEAKNEAQAVTGRIVEGWTCHAGWSVSKGINAPDSELVLALVAEKDPWFQRVHLRDSAHTMNGVVRKLDHYARTHRKSRLRTMTVLQPDTTLLFAAHHQNVNKMPEIRNQFAEKP